MIQILSALLAVILALVHLFSGKLRFLDATLMANLLLPLLKIVAEQTKTNFVKKPRSLSVVQEQFLRELLQIQKDTVADSEKYRVRAQIWTSRYQNYVYNALVAIYLFFNC